MSEAQDPQLPPAVNPETKPFWDAAAQGKLLVQALHGLRRAALLSARHLPVLPLRRHRVAWRPAGTGTIYTYSVMRRRARCRTRIAYVTLDEGVTMMTNIVDCDFDATERSARRVKVVFKPSEDGPPVPMFTPA